MYPELNNYRGFIRDAVHLRNQGSISEKTLNSLIIGASSFIIDRKISRDFTSYIDKKLEPHFHNSLRQLAHF